MSGTFGTEELQVQDANEGVDMELMASVLVY